MKRYNGWTEGSDFVIRQNMKNHLTKLQKYKRKLRTQDVLPSEAASSNVYQLVRLKSLIDKRLEELNRDVELERDGAKFVPPQPSFATPEPELRKQKSNLALQRTLANKFRKQPSSNLAPSPAKLSAAKEPQRVQLFRKVHLLDCTFFLLEACVCEETIVLSLKNVENPKQKFELRLPKKLCYRLVAEQFSGDLERICQLLTLNRNNVPVLNIREERLAELEKTGQSNEVRNHKSGQSELNAFLYEKESALEEDSFQMLNYGGRSDSAQKKGEHSSLNESSSGMERGGSRSNSKQSEGRLPSLRGRWERAPVSSKPSSGLSLSSAGAGKSQPQQGTYQANLCLGKIKEVHKEEQEQPQNPLQEQIIRSLKKRKIKIP